ncbi:MAG: hypothetical protein WBQ43_06715 [Terriglobales bacterium]
MSTELQRLPRPASESIDSSLWVDEAIWGHRLYDEQVPWLTFLEFLTVLRGEWRNDRAFKEPNGPNHLQYPTQHFLYLRNVLFNNPTLSRMLVLHPDDDTRWSNWISDMSKRASGVDPKEFGYLKSRFASMEDFVALVELLRSTAIEGSSNKRWTSKFVFPYGPHCLYEDLRLERDGRASNDRRFFARTGEILYLMLCRSGLGEELIQELRPLVLDENTRWNRLVHLLERSTSEGEVQNRQRSAYLPYPQLPAFKKLAEDWLALLRLRMPGYDVFPHLVDMVGVHLVLYFLQRASEWVHKKPKLTLVLEILAPKRITIRDLAAETYLENNLLSRQAIQKFIDREIVQTDDWRLAKGSSDSFGNAAKVVYERVLWKAVEGDQRGYVGQQTPNALIENLREAVEKRHRQHLANIHSQYSRAIGLASKRGTRTLRYAPTDLLLKTLVFATVPNRMEFQTFLELLHERYCFVVGHRQARQFIGTGASDQRAFEENAKRLELRLSSLGMLKRLSDACAYVQNPLGASQ